MGQPMEGETHIHIAKHRNGSTDTVKVRFIKEYQKFVDLPEDHGFGGFGGDSPFPPPGGHRFDQGGGRSHGLGGRPSSLSSKGPSKEDFSGTDQTGSQLYVPKGYQTLPSKANDFSFDDEDMPPPPSSGDQEDDSVPF